MKNSSGFTHKMGFAYQIVHSQFGEIGIVFKDKKVIRIILPRPRPSKKMKNIIQEIYPKALPRDLPIINKFCQKIEIFLSGKPVNFSLDVIDLFQFYNFQKKVLLLERQIPYGWVSTYGRLAKKLSRRKAARAVGQALARNPFPIVFPCHRTVKSDGTLGGYAGGLKMKRMLLELEGLKFDKYGRVLIKKFW